jgi:hypothetical protein
MIKVSIHRTIGLSRFFKKNVERAFKNNISRDVQYKKKFRVKKM